MIGQKTSWNKRPVAEGMKYCPMCKQEKPRSAFSGKKRLDGYCTPCKGKRGTMLKPSPTVGVRFWKYVEKGPNPDDCWIWTGTKNTMGYGQLWVGGPERLALAHRVSMQLHGLPVPPPGRDIKNGVIDHKCNVHACVNPAHLHVVTQKVNTHRGTSPFAVNALKTHCIHGHEFTPENTKRNASGYRECLACYRLRRPGTKL